MSAPNNLTFFSFTPSFHSSLHHKWLGIADRIQLLNPRLLSITQLKQYYCDGRKTLSILSNFTPHFYLNGNTALKNKNYNDALINLWTSIEQLTFFLMKHFNLANTNKIFSDHEKLLEKDIIPKKLFNKLNEIRKQRNKVIHEGSHATERVTITLKNTIEELIQLCCFYHDNGFINY